MINENLFKAVESGKFTEVEKVLTEEKINTTTYFGVKAVFFAVKHENYKILKMILENGKEVDRKSFWGRCAQPSLSEAARSENVEVMKLLLDYGAGTDEKYLSYALAEAVLTGNQEMINLLIAAGASIDTHLSKTLENNPEDVVKILSNYNFHENALRYAFKCLTS